MAGATAVRNRRLGLHAGDWVIVRSKEEILGTLDQRACVDGLPFQPEMFSFCGQRLRVAKVAHKTCDNIQKTGGRRMADAVHLEGARCDGSSHGLCQADCVFFWKEVWLRKADRPSDDMSSSAEESAGCNLETVLERACDRDANAPDDPTWICQTTALFEATTPLNWWDIRQYVRDVASGNHTLGHMIKLFAFAGYRKFVTFGAGFQIKIWLYNKFQEIRGGKPFPSDHGLLKDGETTPTGFLGLQPGEWVEIRSQDDILSTITKNGFNRGMRYDIEMSKYCGERHRVQMRVDRLINEKTGKMIQMKSPCIQLEGVYCRAECTERRLGCPRASNTYWREIWLRRVDGPRSREGQS